MPTKMRFKGSGAARPKDCNGPFEERTNTSSPVRSSDIPVPILQTASIVILSDVPFVREALAQILDREPRLSVISTAANFIEARTRWSGLHPDMVLLDATSPDSFTMVAPVRELLPTARVIAFAMAETDENVIRWGEAGVASYIPRTATVADVIAGIENTMRGEQSCPPHIAARLLQRLAERSAVSPVADSPVLTTREVEIVHLLAKGLSNKEIARCLHISIATTKSHVHNLLTKLGLPRRSYAAIWVRQHSLVVDKS
jgi:DNA-binding NarL/FixJ family response regulator